MNCRKARLRSTDYLDGRLRASERARVAAHLAECESCTVVFDQLRAVRSALGSLPQPQIPADLRTALRITASRERQAIVDSLGSPLRRAFHRWCFRLNQLMRPLTVPATGGVLTTLILFSSLAFSLSVRTQIATYDVPIFYEDHLNANLVPVQVRSSVLLTFSLDGKGRITDYAVRDGSMRLVGDTGRLQFSNIPLPEFPSVLATAQPVNGDISIHLVPLLFRR